MRQSCAYRPHDCFASIEAEAVLRWIAHRDMQWVGENEIRRLQRQLLRWPQKQMFLASSNAAAPQRQFASQSPTANRLEIGAAHPTTWGRFLALSHENYVLFPSCQ